VKKLNQPFDYDSITYMLSQLIEGLSTSCQVVDTVGMQL